MNRDRPAGAQLPFKFHEYKRKRPTKNVKALLDYIDSGGDPMFLG